MARRGSGNGWRSEPPRFTTNSFSSSSGQPPPAVPQDPPHFAEGEPLGSRLRRWFEGVWSGGAPPFSEGAVGVAADSFGGRTNGRTSAANYDPSAPLSSRVPRSSVFGIVQGAVSGHLDEGVGKKVEKDVEKTAQIRNVRISRECKMLEEMSVEGVTVSSFDSEFRAEEMRGMERVLQLQGSSDQKKTDRDDFGRGSTEAAQSVFGRANDIEDTPTLIQLSVSKQVCGHRESLVDDIRFSIKPLPNFPFSPPFIRCHTKFCFPSVSDGRNLVSEILQSEWSPSVTFVSIASKLPVFIDNVMTRINLLAVEGRLQQFCIGSFDGPLRLEEFLTDESCSVVPCLAFSAETLTAPTLPRCVVLSDSALICCEVKRDPLNVVDWRRSSFSSSDDVPLHEPSTTPTVDWEVDVKFWTHLGHIENLQLLHGAVLVTFNRSVRSDFTDGIPLRQHDAHSHPRYHQHLASIHIQSAAPADLLEAIRDHTNALDATPRIQQSGGVGQGLDLATLEGEMLRNCQMLDDPSFEPSLTFVHSLLQFYQQKVERLANQPDADYSTALSELRNVVQHPRVSPLLGGDVPAQLSSSGFQLPVGGTANSVAVPHEFREDNGFSDKVLTAASTTSSPELDEDSEL